LPETDAIIIGSGHNGLVCASYLVRSGLKVIVLERRDVIGGATVTEEIWPGFKISRASYVPGIVSKITKELELEKYGLKTGPIDPRNFCPFPDGKYLFTFRSAKRTAKEIEKFSSRDARAYINFSSFASKFVETIDPLVLSPPPSMTDLLSLIKGPELEEVIRQVLMTSCKELLDQLFESEYVKAALCIHGVLNTSMGPDTVGTSYILANSLGRTGYKYTVGGTGAVAQALARSFESQGGTILTSREVKQVLVQNGKAIGVELVSGERMFAKVVISNADPKRTFLRMIERENLEPDFIWKVEHLRATGTSLKINIALNEPLNFKAFPGAEVGPQHRALTDISPSIDYIENAYEDCKHGRIPKEPPLSIFSQTASDASVAPHGKHTLSIIAKYNPYHLAGERDSSDTETKTRNWDELKEAALKNALDVLEDYAPNLRRSIIHIEVLSPLDLERVFGLTEGNVTHLDQTLNQMLSFRPLPGYSNYKTPIDGLYLCGTGTHPGGGVTGAPGHNAAHAVLEEWPSLKQLAA
jgi:phytoene dehydrogenase-like protein